MLENLARVVGLIFFGALCLVAGSLVLSAMILVIAWLWQSMP